MDRSMDESGLDWVRLRGSVSIDDGLKWSGQET